MKQSFLVSVILPLAPLAAAIGAPHESVLRVEAERIAAMRRASAATVAIFANSGAGGGSAVVISPDGYALSNFHVTQEAGSAMKCGLPDGKLYDAVIVNVDPTGDVALLKLLGRDDFPHADMGDSDLVRAGDWCFAAGNPFLLANDFTPSISYGVVSGTHRYQYPSGTLLEYTDCIQTDAAINPGNSGGPLFNASGQLIGINGRGSFEKRGRVNVGVGYAISINQIKNFLGFLKSGRIVDHATLGATVSTDEEGRVVVDEIQETSDAYRRGLRYDDEIVRFGDREIQTVNGLKNVIGIYPRGWRVPLSYRREGKTYGTLVRLAALHHESELEKALRGPKAVPNPEKNPKDKSPKDKPDEGERPKLPKLKVPELRAAPMPKIVAEHFEARRGYANYFFNRLHQRRVWDAFIARGDFSSTASAWTLDGELDGGGAAQIQISERLGTVTLPTGESKLLYSDDLPTELAPHGSGGLLVALHTWQRLLTLGPARFGEVYYLGTVPIPTRAELVDVLVGIYGGVETRFYFSPLDGQLVGLEMFPDDDADPCEIYLSDYREVAGRQLPHRIAIEHAGANFAVLSVKEYHLDKPGEP